MAQNDTTANEIRRRNPNDSNSNILQSSNGRNKAANTAAKDNDGHSNGFKTYSADSYDAVTEEEVKPLLLNSSSSSSLLYPWCVSKRMLTTSVLMSIAAIVAAVCKCYLLCIFAIQTVIVSINYWRKPMLGMRRNVDIANSISVGTIHAVYAITNLDSETSSLYLFMCSGVAILYFLSRMAKLNGMMNLDSYLHCSMHLVGICVNSWFYVQLSSKMN